MLATESTNSSSPGEGPSAGACAYSNICEQCDNFVPDPAREPVIAEQLDDIRTIRDDARQRGWTDEAARHERVIEHLERHLTTIGRHNIG